MKTFYTLLLITLFNITLYANNVATITAMKGSVNIKRAQKNFQASLGEKLKQKDTILTKENAKLQVIFKDETIISIGKNSEFSIQEYLFEDNQEPVAKFGMIRGAMRSITGKIGDVAPQKFSVSTKTATIGIRGTNFSVFVNDDGSQEAFCTYGAISVTIAGIVHIVQQGFFIHISPTGKAEVKPFTAKMLQEAREKYFNVGDGKHNGSQGNNNGNNAHLDVIIPNDSGLIIKDITNNARDAIQQQHNEDLSQRPTVPQEPILPPAGFDQSLQ